MRLRLGVVGLGETWERRHKPALLRLSEKFEVRAVYDDVAQRARVQAAEIGCDATEGFTCLIERDDIDALYLLGQPWHGAETVRAACRAGKAVYHGGSIGPEVACAEEAIAAARASSRPFMPEFPWRFYPATIRLMELLASGLGTPQLVSCEQSELVPENQAAALARGNAESSLLALYMADWIRFVCSRDPTHIRSVGGASLRGPCRSFETLVAEFGEDCLGQATVRRYAQPKWSEAAQFQRGSGFHVVAENGVAFLGMPGEISWFDESGRHDETLEMERPLGELLADRFYRIVVHGSNPSPGLEDAVWARRMILEAREQRAGR